ncbi:uncharacterized protein LOC105766253 isoform X2 [Gossypium raimondii]|uniref:uncharacterized protein LOC105766253 isoform X2 n=1 Tax=Gossypium raimondii TaxID=29730 RepID=UPI00227C6023|nr:uncharacterized protein LOC105766253 isoform X2 [Gossypium raimondii]
MVSHFTICFLHHGDGEKVSLFTSFILPASSFGFLFSSDASYDFDRQPPDLKKQELVKRYSKRANATKDLQEAMEVIPRLDGSVQRRTQRWPHVNFRLFSVNT